MSRALKVHLLLLAVVVVASLPIFGFQWHLTLHILAAILFVGGLVSSMLWMALAHCNGTAAVMGFAASATRQAGLLLVAPAAALALLNGLMMSADRWGGWGGFHEHRWIEIALALFVLAVVLWGAFVHRYMVKLARLGEQAAIADGPLSAETNALLKLLVLLGAVVVSGPVRWFYLLYTYGWLSSHDTDCRRQR